MTDPTPIYDDLWREMFPNTKVMEAGRIVLLPDKVYVKLGSRPIKRPPAKACPECRMKRGHKMDCPLRR